MLHQAAGQMQSDPDRGTQMNLLSRLLPVTRRNVLGTAAALLAGGLLPGASAQAEEPIKIGLIASL